MVEKKSYGDYVPCPELELIEFMERNELATLEAEKPIVLYTVGSKGVTSRLENRICDTMQLFGFQPGISAPDAKGSASVDLPELE